MNPCDCRQGRDPCICKGAAPRYNTVQLRFATGALAKAQFVNASYLDASLAREAALQERLTAADQTADDLRAHASFQPRVQPWLMECFGPMIAGDREERNHRFLEEALELVQACGASASEAHQLVDYVYGRPVGEPSQEVGGVMVTLAALCLANGMDMHAAAETELARIWMKVEQIRAKQAAKPSMSPLPGVYPERQQPARGFCKDWLNCECGGDTQGVRETCDNWVKA